MGRLGNVRAWGGLNASDCLGKERREDSKGPGDGWGGGRGERKKEEEKSRALGKASPWGSAAASVACVHANWGRWALGGSGGGCSGRDKGERAVLGHGKPWECPPQEPQAAAHMESAGARDTQCPPGSAHKGYGPPPKQGVPVHWGGKLRHRQGA